MTPARPASLALSLLAATALAGCATWTPPEIAYDNDPVPATLVPEPPRPVQVVEVPRPLPLPGQLQRVEARRATPEAPDPTARDACCKNVTKNSQAKRHQKTRIEWSAICHSTSVE